MNPSTNSSEAFFPCLPKQLWRPGSPHHKAAQPTCLLWGVESSSPFSCLLQLLTLVPAGCLAATQNKQTFPCESSSTFRCHREHSYFQAKQPLSAAVPPVCPGFHTLMSDGPTWNVLPWQPYYPVLWTPITFAFASLVSVQPRPLKWSLNLNIERPKFGFLWHSQIGSKFIFQAFVLVWIFPYPPWLCGLKACHRVLLGTLSLVISPKGHSRVPQVNASRIEVNLS